MNAKKKTLVDKWRIVKTQQDLTSAIVSPKGLNTMRKEGDALVRNALWGYSVNINDIGMIGNFDGSGKANGQKVVGVQESHCYFQGVDLTPKKE